MTPSCFGAATMTLNMRVSEKEIALHPSLTAGARHFLQEELRAPEMKAPS